MSKRRVTHGNIDFQRDVFRGKNEVKSFSTSVRKHGLKLRADKFHGFVISGPVALIKDFLVDWFAGDRATASEMYDFIY